MEIKKEIELLEKSKEFKGWHEKNKNNYLSYALFMTGEEEDKVEIGYYNKKNDKVTTFCILGCDKKKRKIEIRPEENIFKKPGMEVEELKAEDVKLDIAEVLSIAEKLQKKKYPVEIPVKVIIILQKLKPYGEIYNLTYVTRTFKTLNIKIDTETGDIVEDRLVSLMQFPGK